MRFSRTQTGTRQKAKRPSAWMSHRCQAFNHRPVSADPRHRAHHPHHRGSLPLPQPLRKRPGCKACHMARAGHRPLGQAALSRAEAGASGDATPSIYSPAGPLREKSLQPGFTNSSKPTPVLYCFPTLGTTRRPLSVTLPTFPSSPNLLLCMLVPSLLPACQEPQKTGGGGGGPSGPTTPSSSAAPGRRELKSARKRQRGGVGLRGGGGTGLKLLFLANGDLFFLLPGG